MKLGINGLPKRLQAILMAALISIMVLGCSLEVQTEQPGETVQETDETRKLEESVADSNVIEKTDSKVEVSMEEAIEIAQAEADRYYDNLMLTEVHSYDNDEVRDIKAGESGKREWWYVNFANDELNYVNVLIEDGEIVSVHNFDNNGNNGIFDLADVKITAEEAVHMAQEIGLRGGDPQKEEWVAGYNFKLSYASLQSSPEDIKLFLEIIGISPEGNFAHVDFDATTGELLLAEEKIEHVNGDVEWKTFIQIEGE